jgi:hypothetical protein
MIRFGAIAVSLLVATSLTSAAADERFPKYTPATKDRGKTYWAWDYAGAWTATLPPGYKLVAADLALPASPGDPLDLDDIEVFDADTGESFGSGPAIQRLTPEGEFVDENDPAVEARKDYRGIFIWAVRREVRRINFGYWGDMLFTRPVDLRPEGRTVPDPSLEVAAIGPNGSTDGYDRHLGVLHAVDWSRIRTPARHALHATGGGPAGDTCACDRWIEVDAHGRPVDTPVAARPYYARDRWFLAEFWCPAGRRPDALDVFGDRTALPKAAPPKVDPAARRRLAAAPRNPDARHRVH